MTFNTMLTTIQDWWNAGLVTILLKGVIVYIGLLWLGGIVWTMRDSFLRSESIPFHITAFLLSLLTIPGILLYMLIRPAQSVAERKILTLEEEVLRSTQEKENRHKNLHNRPHQSRSPERIKK